ncbi:phosphatidylglycerophosphatase A [Alteromonadaceae bacterium M269]|nr:phosphatidylglycerophosphatase A [Alteromonadaceae bacterium M269]
MDKSLRSKLSLKNPIHFLALGFGSGLAPFMPGTFGSLAALPVVYVVFSLPLVFSLILIALSCIVGIWICGKTADDMGVHDHSGIVWDEIAGMLVTFLGIAISWQTLVAGFLLFRLFDIVKPWPISYLDKHLDGGLGIMLDDILAGIAACACLHGLVYWQVLF